MDATIEATATPTPVVRPKEVWAVTIWLGLFAGLLPVILSLFIYFGPARDQVIISGMGLAISLTIGLAIIWSAIAAWLGHGWARYALIALAIIHYGLLAYNNYNIATSGIVPDDKLARVWARVFRSLITMTIVALYLLLSRSAKDFFKNYRNAA
ncbi:MAG: hypothetical protein ACO1QB_14055 [Verrucomicrobiales bacterium]